MNYHYIKCVACSVVRPVAQVQCHCGIYVAEPQYPASSRTYENEFGTFVQLASGEVVPRLDVHKHEVSMMDEWRRRVDERRRRDRAAKRKAERNAPKPSEIRLRAKLDNQFLYDMRIWQVEFDREGRIVCEAATQTTE